jgi:hypothetical protein
MRGWLDDLVAGNLFEEDDYTGMSDHNRECVVQLAYAMLSQFNQRWGTGEEGTVFNKEIVRGARRIRVGIPVTTWNCAYLDPRTKGLSCMPDADKKEFMNHIEEELLKEYHARVIIPDVPEVPVNSKPSLLSRLKSAAVVPNSPDALPIRGDEVCLDNVRLEIRNYVAFAILHEQGDPLQWHRNHKDMFPLHSALARRYLCIPATSAASERTFSTSGNIISQKRGRLGDSIVGDMVFLFGTWDEAEAYLKSKKQRGA